jgi:cytochrome c-type biogenesis protein CcmH/NrfG
MFFPKLRRRAKWVFAFLAVAFALAFVVAGVGTGLGSGFGDYLADLFNRQPGTEETSLAQARERVRENPRDAEAQLALATALQGEGRTDDAILALDAYTKLRPNDAEAFQALAGLYAIKATAAEQRAQAAQVEGSAAFFGNELSDPSGALAEQLGTDPITQYLQQQTSQAYQTAFTQAQEARRQEAAAWRELTQLEPDDANNWLSLGLAAQQANDFPEAIRAYTRYLRLAPDSPQTPQIRQLVKQLKQQAASPVSGAGAP